jgi:hypothetical protein
MSKITIYRLMAYTGYRNGKSHYDISIGDWDKPYLVK